jgi:biopolymer transport protein ExbB/TolQ
MDPLPPTFLKILKRVETSRMRNMKRSDPRHARARRDIALTRRELDHASDKAEPIVCTICSAGPTIGMKRIDGRWYCAHHAPQEFITE